MTERVFDIWYANHYAFFFIWCWSFSWMGRIMIIQHISIINKDMKCDEGMRWDQYQKWRRFFISLYWGRWEKKQQQKINSFFSFYGSFILLSRMIFFKRSLRKVLFRSIYKSSSWFLIEKQRNAFPSYHWRQSFFPTLHKLFAFILEINSWKSAQEAAFCICLVSAFALLL